MDLDPRIVTALVARAVEEDVGRGDVTTVAVVPHGATGRATVVARAPCVVAGLDVARACFEHVAAGPIGFERAVPEGARAAAGDVLVRLEGVLRAILTAERVALNLLARACGVATTTAEFVAAAAPHPARIVDTRKTTPGLRALEKYAVAVGGGHNHRSGLDDGVLIKDNHVAAAGGVGEAVARVRTRVPHGMLIEVEVTTLAQLDEAVAAGAHAVLLDNMTPEEVEQAVRRAGGKVLLEASGGIDASNVGVYAATGVDVISVGALTHSARHIDLALEVE